MKLKKYLFLITATALGFACNPMADTDEMDKGAQSTRIAFYPQEVLLDTDGLTTEEESGQKVIVTVNPNGRKKMAWKAESNAEWCKIEEISVQSNGVTERGFRITTLKNELYKRWAAIKVTATDGTVNTLTVTQTGLLADAEIGISTESMEFKADNIEPIDLSFTTNMGDVYAVTADADWVKWEDLGNRTIRFSVTEWDHRTEGRSTKAYITVGSKETSLATATIEISQLARDLYCYLYGTELFDYPTADKAARMTKVEENVYKIDAYYVKKSNGTLCVKSSENAYYALTSEGTIVSLASENASAPAGAVIDIDGMRSLEINLATMSYTLGRIQTQNCMPDSEVANYPTKAFIARDGSMKTWMTVSCHWDGGAISPKLGSQMVPSAAVAIGGYTSDALLPQSLTDPLLNPAYETVENGGSLVGESTYGRIYCYSEMLTGVPRGGIDAKINQNFPTGWQIGDVITDAVGRQITLQNVVNPTDFSGDNSADEQAIPMLEMQAQGICPYGWHIANAADHLDLAYAAAMASVSDSYPVKVERVTYKQFSTASGTATTTADSPRGIGNLACWYKNTTYWSNTPIADGADAFGFNLYPLGFRYLKQGYQMAGLRYQTWIPLYYNAQRAYRINVVINKNTATYSEMTYVDNGNAIMPFRCVKNYKK